DQLQDAAAAATSPEATAPAPSGAPRQIEGHVRSAPSAAGSGPPHAAPGQPLMILAPTDASRRNGLAGPFHTLPDPRVLRAPLVLGLLGPSPGFRGLRLPFLFGRRRVFRLGR